MQPHSIPIDAQVRLMKDIPQLQLHRGDVGVVCSIWHAGASSYEVEFRSTENAFGIRTVLCDDDVAEDMSADSDFDPRPLLGPDRPADLQAMF
jgi:hypothetical protein